MNALRVGRGQSIWILLVGFGIGLLSAFPFAAPIMGSVLPDASATLWGSALGAMVAVAGASWMAQSAERRQRRNAADLILALIEPISSFLDELCGAYGSPTNRTDRIEVDQEPDPLSPDDWREVRSAATHLLERIELLSKRAHRIDGVLGVLGSAALDSYFAIEDELDALVSVIERLRDEAFKPQVRLYPAHASWSLRFAVSVHGANLREFLGELRRAAR